MGLQAGLPALDFGGIRGAKKREYFAAVHAALGREYYPMTGARLSLVNRYLRNPELREKTVTKSVATSSAIEGIRAPFRRGVHSEANRKSLLIRKRP